LRSTRRRRNDSEQDGREDQHRVEQRIVEQQILLHGAVERVDAVESRPLPHA